MRELFKTSSLVTNCFLRWPHFDLQTLASCASIELRLVPGLWHNGLLGCLLTRRSWVQSKAAFIWLLVVLQALVWIGFWQRSSVVAHWLSTLLTSKWQRVRFAQGGWAFFCSFLLFHFPISIYHLKFLHCQEASSCSRQFQWKGIFCGGTR